MGQILAISPLALELKALLESLREMGFDERTGQVGRLNYYEFPELHMRFSTGGLGKAQFALQTQFMLGQYPNVEAVICFGAAGALTETTKILDVVIATKTVEHDFKQKVVPSALPEFAGDPKLLKQLASLKVGSFGLHLGPIASGDEDVIDQNRGEEIRKSTGALAVAWEGAGAARACKFSHMPFLEMRAITDFVSDQVTLEKFSANLRPAMRNVASLLVEITKISPQ